MPTIMIITRKKGEGIHQPTNTHKLKPTPKKATSRIITNHEDDQEAK